MALLTIHVTYLIGVLAVEKEAFGKLSAEDQAVVREEMDKVFKRMNAINRADNEAAKLALQRHGITFVTPKPGETERWRSLADQSIEEMVQTGVVPGEIVDQVRKLLQSLRNSQ